MSSRASPPTEAVPIVLSIEELDAISLFVKAVAGEMPAIVSGTHTFRTILDAVAERQRVLEPRDQVARLDRFKLMLPKGGPGKLLPLDHSGAELELTELSRNQLLARLGIPPAYFDRCPARLQREHVRWFMTQEEAARPVRLRIVPGANLSAGIAQDQGAASCIRL